MGDEPGDLLENEEEDLIQSQQPIIGTEKIKTDTEQETEQETENLAFSKIFYTKRIFFFSSTRWFSFSVAATLRKRLYLWVESWRKCFGVIL